MNYQFDFDTVVDRNGWDAMAVETIPFEDAQIREGFGRIPMWVADMNFATAPSIQRAVIERAQHPAFGYFFPRDEYYDAIIFWHRIRKHVADIPKEAIGYENGVLGCLSTALHAFTQPGENILFLAPVYVGFTATMEATRRTIVRSELREDADGIWRMNYEDMDRKIKENRIRFAVFCSPHNPCGRVWEREEIEQAMDVFRKNDCIVFSDEIWSDLILYPEGFGQQPVHIPTQSISEDAKNRVIACYAPTKTFNLAGFIGSYHVIYNEELRTKMEKQAASTGYNHMNILSMYALIGGYSEEGDAWLEQLLAVLSRNVDYACSFIRHNFRGVRVSRPQGTYMLFLDCSGWCHEHQIPMDELIRAGISVGVIWQDGRPFGGDYTIRMNLALPTDIIKEAFDRLQKYVFCAD